MWLSWGLYKAEVKVAGTGRWSYLWLRILGACLFGWLVVSFLPCVPCRDDCAHCALTVSRGPLHETQQMCSELCVKLADSVTPCVP